MRYALKLLVPAFVAALVTLSAHPQVKPKSKAGPAAKTTPVSNQKTAAPNVVPISSDPTKCTSKSGLSSTEITELLTAHNRARIELKLSPLSWDCTLANYAQEWATRGIFEHRDTEYGENIFVASNPAAAMSVVMGQWLGEKQYWDNTKGTCAPGKTCTHYTQTVWKATTKLGCGVNRTAAGKWKAILVCNYDPAGNSSGPAY